MCQTAWRAHTGATEKLPRECCLPRRQSQGWPASERLNRLRTGDRMAPEAPANRRDVGRVLSRGCSRICLGRARAHRGNPLPDLLCAECAAPPHDCIRPDGPVQASFCIGDLPVAGYAARDATATCALPTRPVQSTRRSQSTARRRPHPARRAGGNHQRSWRFDRSRTGSTPSTTSDPGRATDPAGARHGRLCRIAPGSRPASEELSVDDGVHGERRGRSRAAVPS